MQRVKDMMSSLNDMLEADARGEHTQEQFGQFMQQYGDFFPDSPQNLEELVDSLARRAAATQRMLASMTPEQRDELANLMASALEDMDLSAQMSRLQSSLRSRRPDLDWSGRERMRGRTARSRRCHLCSAGPRRSRRSGVEPGAELRGASLDDIDEDAVRRALGRQAVDDVTASGVSNASWSTRATSPGGTGGSSSPPRPYDASVRPRCAASSRRCNRRDGVTTTSTTPVLLES